MRKALLIVSVAVFGLSFGGHCINKRTAGNMPEEKNMKNNNIYVKDGYRCLDPDIVRVKEPIRWIFPVPEPTAVGTICWNNAITFIKFGTGSKKPEYKIIARNFSKRVYDNYDYRFSPNFSDDIIVYTKTRIAVIANVKTGKVFHAEFNATWDDYLYGIRFLDPQNNLFAIFKSTAAGDWQRDSLHIARLEGKQLIDLGSVMRVSYSRPSSVWPSINRWIVHDHMLIAYDGKTVFSHHEKDGSGNLRCFDSTGKETTHPFAEIFNRNKGNTIDIRDMAVHPELPFGLVVGRHDITRVHSLFLVRWDTVDTNEQFAALHYKLLLLAHIFDIPAKYFAITYTSFSPDGKWFVAGCFTYNGYSKPRFIAIPVSKKDPNFLDLDKLIILGKVEGMTALAWSTDPTAFVVADGSDHLYKWVLD